jgi:hypothetical protein
MTLQTIYQLILLLGIIMTGIGGYGAYYYGKVEENEQQIKSDNIQHDLKSQITRLQATLETKTDLIFQALKVKQDIWIAVETKTVPPTSAYLLLLFKSDNGRISGKVRVQGSDSLSSFSTTANDTVPVAVQNLWLPNQHEYKTPIIVEFSVTEKTVPDSTLNIFTQGWVDDLGQEPH